jgi:hypothetical protein
VTLLCSVVGCAQERKCKAYCDELDGGNGRARVNARFEYAEWCFACSRRVEWVRLEDGSVRVILRADDAAA